MQSKSNNKYKYDLVIFDCDGTLVDTESLLNGVISDVLVQMGYDKYTPEYCLEHFCGYDKSYLEEVIYNELGKDFDFASFEDKLTKYGLSRVMQGTVAMKNSKEIIRELQSKNIKTCVASNGDRINVVASLKVTGLLEFFAPEHIFTYEQVARPKPAADLFLFAAEQMQADGNRCLVIEDSFPGMQAAINAHIDVLGINHQNKHDVSRLETLKPLAIIDDLIKIKEYI